MRDTGFGSREQRISWLPKGRLEQDRVLGS